MKLAVERLDEAERNALIEGERARCVAIVHNYLSSRQALRLARHPRDVLEQIIDDIRA